jgi:hypothetical protein
VQAEVVMIIFSLVSAAIGAYFGAYLKKKGENAAVREEFAEIKDQLRETTLATEQIRRSLTTELWLAQEKWKLRKELYLSMLNSIEAIIEGLREIESMASDADRIKELEDSEERQRFKQGFEERMSAISAELRKAKASAKLVSARASAIMDDLEGPALDGLEPSDAFGVLKQAIAISERV